MISNEGTEICVARGYSLWLAPEPFLWSLKMQAEHIEYAWLCSRSEIAIFV